MEQEREAFEAWRTEYYRTHTLPEPDSGDWAWAGWQARAAIAAQQAAQPVAWVNADELDNMLDDRTATIAGRRDGWRTVPLYAGGGK